MSVKGQTWGNHRYVKKIGNRYIYPEDLQGLGSRTNIASNLNNKHTASVNPVTNGNKNSPRTISHYTSGGTNIANDNIQRIWYKTYKSQELQSNIATGEKAVVKAFNPYKAKTTYSAFNPANAKKSNRINPTTNNMYGKTSTIDNIIKTGTTFNPANAKKAYDTITPTTNVQYGSNGRIKQVKTYNPGNNTTVQMQLNKVTPKDKKQGADTGSNDSANIARAKADANYRSTGIRNITSRTASVEQQKYNNSQGTINKINNQKKTQIAKNQTKRDNEYSTAKIQQDKAKLNEKKNKTNKNSSSTKRYYGKASSYR